MNTISKHIRLWATLTFAILFSTLSHAQHNVYVLNDTTPQTVSVFAGVDKISYFGDKAIVQYGNKTREIPVTKIKKLALSEPKNQTNANVPPSYMADLDFDITFEPGDAELASDAEAEITDIEDKTYDDFVSHTPWLHTIIINYGGSKATAEGDLDSVSVDINGNHVVVNSNRKNVAYILRGQSDNGSFKLYGSDKFKLVLDNVELTNPKGPAINSQCKKRMFLVLAEGSENSLTDAKDYAKVSGEDQKGCVFSEGQICLSGNGSLVVNGLKKNGIASDQYVHILNGFTRINTTQKKGAGIKVQTRFMMGGGALQILAEGDASKGIASDSLVTITGGKVTAICTGDAIWADDEQDYSASCGIKSDRTMSISNAEIRLLSTGTGGKCISAGKLLNTYVSMTDSQGNTVEKIEVKKEGSSSVSFRIKERAGDLTIENTKLYCKTAGMRPERKISFSNAESDLFYYPGEDATSTKKFSMTMSSSPKAVKAANNITISNSETYIRCSGGNGGEGIEAKNAIKIYSTKIRNLCFDDGINALNTVIDEDCDIFVYSYDNDGIDSKLEKCGGKLYCLGGTGDQRGIDTDNGAFAVPEGTRIISLGGNAGHDPRKGQNSIMAYVYGNPGYITIVDSVTNNDIITIKAPANYQRLNILISVPEIEIGRTYRILSFKNLISGTEDAGCILSPVYEREKAKTEYSFTTKEAATVLTKEDDSGGGGGEDDADVILGTEPFRIVNSAYEQGGVSIADGAVYYNDSDDDSNWWYIDTKGTDKRRFRNVVTDQCIAAPPKEYNNLQLVATGTASPENWWTLGSKDGYYQFYLPKGTSTKWYFKTKDGKAVTADRYSGNSTFWLIDKNGNKK